MAQATRERAVPEHYPEQRGPIPAVPGSDEVLFIGYQYGMVARKIEE